MNALAQSASSFVYVCMGAMLWFYPANVISTLWFLLIFHHHIASASILFSVDLLAVFGGNYFFFWAEMSKQFGCCTIADVCIFSGSLIFPCVFVIHKHCRMTRVQFAQHTQIAFCQLLFEFPASRMQSLMNSLFRSRLQFISLYTEIHCLLRFNCVKFFVNPSIYLSYKQSALWALRNFMC